VRRTGRKATGLPVSQPGHPKGVNGVASEIDVAEQGNSGSSLRTRGHRSAVFALVHAWPADPLRTANSVSAQVRRSPRQRGGFAGTAALLALSVLKAGVGG